MNKAKADLKFRTRKRLIEHVTQNASYKLQRTAMTGHRRELEEQTVLCHLLL